MCGVFAYAGQPGHHTPRIALLHAVARAARRGPHGHGWVSETGARYQGGRALDVEDLPIGLRLGSWVLGHSRLATVATHNPRDVTALQPVVRDGHVLVHNGTLPDWTPDHGGRTDSHWLAHRYSVNRSRGLGPATALQEALDVGGADAFAVIVRDVSGGLWATRQDLPLYGLHTDHGVYLSSVTFAEAGPLTEGGVHHLTASTRETVAP